MLLTDKVALITGSARGTGAGIARVFAREGASVVINQVREGNPQRVLEEIQAARPLRIKVITVQPGDTVDSLSHRMAGVDRAAERFRVLNGLEPHAQVRPRDRVKIVVD